MEGIRLMLVDDEDEFLDTLIKRLTKRSLAAFAARSGEEALDMLSRNPVDVVILDVRMPGMDGIETLREIKRRHPLIEVIMLTGHANVEVAVEGMQLGAFDYLMKPMDIDELLYKAEDAFKSKSLKQKTGRSGMADERPSTQAASDDTAAQKEKD